MPKATAVWLIENTTLTFDQIADFCDLHILEVKGIADGDVATGVLGADPISNGQVIRAEIEKAEKDPQYKMVPVDFDRPEPAKPTLRRKTRRYTPLSRRQDRPDAISWILRNHPEISDAQISRLIGTTKPTIKAIRDRTHWKSTTINPTDPVSLGLCSQIDLDAVVAVASRKKAGQDAKAKPDDEGEALKPIGDGAGEPAQQHRAKPKHTLESLFKSSGPGG